LCTVYRGSVLGLRLKDAAQGCCKTPHNINLKSDTFPLFLVPDAQLAYTRSLSPDLRYLSFPSSGSSHQQVARIQMVSHASIFGSTLLFSVSDREE
jgi:hypothetical protein